ncbi:1-deoxy-D-xylulose-5-phosphate synthase [Candidatus Sumerlaeota bacterium]|nr:1-deoxy-D-xylulose-5-phosphate synthase [Candidatus Sumerlaeota bacterium]
MTTPLLDQINCPADLKPLSEEQLLQLCQEMRKRIITTVSELGGHLAPSLGTVELTVALCRILDLPRDQVIWDVGHQAYGWKLLTGRRDQFHTIRQHGGLSGFLKRDESEFDAFGAGHASTSIAAAWGMASARDLRGEDHRVVAVIGDGAMTGGLAYEALNNIGDRQTRMAVILNDNEMSISGNTGAMSRYLRDLVNSHFYTKTKAEVAKHLDRIPLVGHTIVEAVKSIEGGLRHVIVPGLLFESLGFRYIGPIDGHDLRGLFRRLPRVLDSETPILLHVVTQKGKGFHHAEGDPVHWHGVGAFEIESGKSKPNPRTFTHIFGEGLAEMAERDERVVAITAAMPDGTGTSIFAERHPKRFFDVGIAEGCAVTFAAGLAACGLRPVCAIYSTFLQRAFDQVIHDVAIQRLPVIFALDRGGLVGADGATHHGVFDLSYLRCIPNMTVMVPRDEAELLHMMHTAIHHTSGPIAFRYPRGNVLGVEMPGIDDLQRLPIGKAEVLSEGRDAVLLATGVMVGSALRAQQALREMGIDVGVVNARFVKPLDEVLINRLAQARIPLFSMEDNVAAGGFGAAVNEHLAATAPHATACQVLALPDHFIEHGPVPTLHAEADLSPEKITARIAATLEAWRSVPTAAEVARRRR